MACMKDQTNNMKNTWKKANIIIAPKLSTSKLCICRNLTNTSRPPYLSDISEVNSANDYEDKKHK